MDTVRLSAGNATEIRDDLLVSLDEAVKARAALESPMGAGTALEAEPEELDPNERYDLEITKPRAVDLRKLWALAGKPAPADIQAALGPSVPILLYHGLTPFPRPGQSPGGVWGIGYQVQLADPDDAATVSLVPETEMTKVASIDQSVEIGLALGGEMAVPDSALEVVTAVPGITLHGVKVGATTDQRFALSIHLDLSLVKVLSGPVGAGGARWHLYRQEDRLDRFQPLLQTLLIPKGIDRLIMTITTWVRRRGLFFGLLGSRQWSPQPLSLEVSLEGLDS